MHHVLGTFEMQMLVAVLKGIAISHKTASITALDDDLMPVVEVSSSAEAEYSLEEAHIGGPVDGGSIVNKVVLSDELIAFVNTGSQIAFHAPPEVNFLEEDQQFVGNDVEVHGVWSVCVDGVRGTVHTHGACLDVELDLPEEVDALHAHYN